MKQLVVALICLMFWPAMGHAGEGKYLYILRADRPYKVQRLKMREFSYLGVSQICVALESGKQWCQFDDGNAIWLTGSKVSNKWLIERYKFLWEGK